MFKCWECTSNDFELIYIMTSLKFTLVLIMMVHPEMHLWCKLRVTCTDLEIPPIHKHDGWGQVNEHLGQVSNSVKQSNMRRCRKICQTEQFEHVANSPKQNNLNMQQYGNFCISIKLNCLNTSQIYQIQSHL